MESLPEINAAARRQWSVTRGTEANSGQHNLGEQIVEANNKGTNQPFTGAVLSQLHLDLYDKLENGSHARRPIRNPTVAGHGEQRGRGRNNSINETEIDVTGAINDSLEAKCASFEHTVRSVDTLTGNKVRSYQLKSTADFCVDDVTLRRPVASTTPVKSRANSTSSVGRDRSGTARRLSAEGDSVSGWRGLRTAESGKPRHRGLSPRRDWGIADGVLTHKERQTVRSLVSPTLVNHLSPEDAWNEDQGNRRRSRSDVRYDALPVLDNGEIDAHSYRFSPTSCHKYIPEIGHSDKPPQGGHHSDSPTHRLIDARYKLTTQDETSKSNENLHPPSDEQEHGFKSHHKLSKHYYKEAEHFGTQVFNQRSPTESFNTHQEHRTSQLLPTAGRHQRRNAVVHIMESLAERSRSDSFREERYVTVTDETQQRGRLRRDTCTLNTSGAPLRFKQGPRDILTLPKRRRAYSDLSSNDKVPSKSIAARRLSINSQQRLMRAQLVSQDLS